MALNPGSRLGPYEILAPLGVGGMGEVYRARDTRLDRDVAVKILPDRFATNPDFQGRFEREAKAIAAISHPNILAVHDFGKDGATLYLVTEMLEGGTLRERLEEKPQPVRKATDWGLQIARGLAAAHDKGIVHRDLKPENVFITRDGHAKILDFGLATAAAQPEGAGLTQLPTRGPRTEPGAVLGTVGYMSPEQVRGRPVDPRSDLFSFGAILHEMLSGRRTFQRDSAADTMTAILKEEPLDLLQGGRAIPPALDSIVRHCLEKDPVDRFQSTRDLVYSLQAVEGSSDSSPAARVEGSPRPAIPRRGTVIGATALAAGLLAGLGIGWRLATTPPGSPPTVRYLTYSGEDGDPSASPDGRLIAYTSVRDGRPQIWLKQYPGGDEVGLTTGQDTRPRFSPDGSMVLFVRGAGTESSLYKVPVVGGEPRKVLDDARDGDWSPDGRHIVFLREGKEKNNLISILGVVEATGDGSREIAREENARLGYPRWSPDGSTIAVIRAGAENAANDILLVGVDKGGERILSPPPPTGILSSAAWLGSGEALIYAQSESVVTGGMAGGTRRIVRQEVGSGSARTVLSIPVMAPVLDVLGTGRLLLGSEARRQNLRVLPLPEDPEHRSGRWLTRGNGIDRQPVFSPDGDWVLFSSNRSGNLDLWKVSSKTGALRRVTEDAADDWDPGFTPDGQNIVWSSSRSGQFEIWTCASDGTGARQVTRDGTDAENPTVTADGRWIVYNSRSSDRPGIWRIHPDGSGAERVVAGTWSTPDVSPDGTWVAFRSATRPRSLHAARLADGAIDSLAIDLPVIDDAARPRWIPGGRSLAFTAANDAGVTGVFLQDFVPGKDTTASRRPLAGFDPNAPVETFALSPDGLRVVYSDVDVLRSVMLAEGVPGVEPPRRPAP